MKREETKKNNKLQNEKYNQKGITLIALVITIIVLIILAGISINLVLGENGLFNKAKSATVETQKAKFVEDAGLAYSEVYMEKVEKSDSNTITIGDVVSKLISSYGYTEEQIIKPSNEVTQIALSGTQIFLEPNETRKVVVTLEKAYYVLIENLYYPINLTNSRVTIGEGVKNIPTVETSNEIGAEVASGNENDLIEVAVEGTTITIKAKENHEGKATVRVTYGSIKKEILVTIKKVDLGPVAVTVNDEEQTLKQGWKYFCEENDKVWLIYSDIMEGTVLKTEGKIEKNENHIYSIVTVNRNDLLNYLNGKESYANAWEHIKVGIKKALDAKEISVKDNEIEVKGSPDVQLFQKAYDQMYPDEKFEVQGDNNIGWKYRIGETKNFTDIVRIKESSNKPLFFVSNTYWLSSSSAYDDRVICYVQSDGLFYHYGHLNGTGVRPVVSIPKAAFEQLVN